MVITSDQIPIIWQGIDRWMKIKDITPSELARLTGISEESIKSGIKGIYIQLSSWDLPRFVDAFGLRNARNRSFEDFADVLTDEECIQLLTAPLNEEQPRQRNLFD